MNDTRIEMQFLKLRGSYTKSLSSCAINCQFFALVFFIVLHLFNLGNLLVLYANLYA
jgi:hypothetical protein